MKTITRHKSLVALVVACVIYALIPLFEKSPYYLDLLIVMVVYTVLAMMFVMTLRAGLVNLGIVPFWGIGAYTSALLATKLHMNVWLCMPVSAIVTGVIALGIGYFLIGSGASGLSFVILTSVIGMIFNVLVGSISFLGAWNGIPNIPPPESISFGGLFSITFDSHVPFLYLGLFLFVVILLISKAFYSSWVGRAWTAIDLNPRVAASLGINIFKYKMLSFVLSCTLCGLIGSFFAHYEGFILPNTFGMWQNIYVQIYAILGGLSFPVLGPFVGSAVMTFIPEFLRIAREVSPIFNGLVLILLILFLPEGLLGLGKYRSNIPKIRKAISSLLSGGKARSV
ncbi:MAG: branched-chain amino acid ABC transporter permease [Dehalococcoidia bacterium]|jgi:branched-chain amino acid transport system permease protein